MDDEIRELTHISIHSPHARGDVQRGADRKMLTLFQSTPLMRGETMMNLYAYQRRKHFNPLPSCEGRQTCKGFTAPWVDFNPLPSCEGRLYTRKISGLKGYFNPLPSCEGRLVYP